MDCLFVVSLFYNNGWEEGKLSFIQYLLCSQCFMGITSFNLHPSGLRWISLSPLFQTRKLRPWRYKWLYPGPQSLAGIRRSQNPGLLIASPGLCSPLLGNFKGVFRDYTKRSFYSNILGRMLSRSFISGVPPCMLSDSWDVSPLLTLIACLLRPTLASHAGSRPLLF